MVLTLHCRYLIFLLPQDSSPFARLVPIIDSMVSKSPSPPALSSHPPLQVYTRRPRPLLPDSSLAQSSGMFSTPLVSTQLPPPTSHILLVFANPLPGLVGFAVLITLFPSISLILVFPILIEPLLERLNLSLFPSQCLWLFKVPSGLLPCK
jgi:hypothetical protein